MNWLEHLSHWWIPEPNSGCYIWFGRGSGSRRIDRPYGRPSWRSEGKDFYIATVVCEYYHGSRPSGAQVRHLCNNLLCVNPDHLTWGTQSENMLDKSPQERLRLAKIAGNAARSR